MKAIMLTKQNAHRISMVRRKDETCMPRSLKSDIHSICQKPHLKYTLIEE